jgi:hypothetical protein
MYRVEVEYGAWFLTEFIASIGLHRNSVIQKLLNDNAKIPRKNHRKFTKSVLNLLQVLINNENTSNKFRMLDWSILS